MALLPLIDPITSATAYFGGIRMSMWTWSCTICPSMMVLPRCPASSRSTGPRKPRIWPYSAFFRPFGIRCSSATTLIMHRLKFGGQQFAKCPDMIRQSSGHRRCSRVPLGLDQSRDMWRRLRQRQAQTHVRPCEVVERLKQDHAPSHLGAILTETPAFAHQRCQGMTQGQVETLDQTGADR